LREIESWNPKKDPSLHVWLFPWLTVEGDKFEVLGVWEAVRLKLGSWLADWVPSDERGLETLTRWRPVLKESCIDSLVNRYILPKLVLLLKNEFTVNPASQDLQPLEWVLQWFESEFLKASIVVHLLETELFPKWHKVLWAWLSSPQMEFEEVSEWYSSWKELFPESLKPLLQNQFRFGLDLMNQAMMVGSPEELGPLPPLPTPMALLEEESSVGGKPKTQERPGVRKEQLSFVDYVSRLASEQGVEFLPLPGKVHPGTGKALYKLSSSSGGKGGLVVFADNGVLFARLKNDWEPISVDVALELAGGS
jgi:tuftelin-interacting protein 11